VCAVSEAAAQPQRQLNAAHSLAHRRTPQPATVQCDVVLPLRTVFV
jgi:hypothetical protein